MRQAKKYEVGTYQNKVGFTVTYSDDFKEHFLFSPQDALTLGELLVQVAKSMQVTVATDGVSVGLVETPKQVESAGFIEGVGVSDHINIGLTTPVDEGGGAGYENGSKKIH